ncbi:MAG: PrpF domain-containing protein, partial [Desulfobacterales bacterium]
YTIAGVPGPSAKIVLRFDDPGGALTGKLFPTGNVKDMLDVPEVGTIELTVIDAANPVILVQAAALGLSGLEIDEVDNDASIRQRLENVRCAVSVEIGLTETMEEATSRSQAVPKIAFITAAETYQTLDGNTINETDVDLIGRMMSMGTLHKSYAVSGAVSTVGAAMIPGTVAHDLLKPEAHQKEMLSIGHPGGIIDVGAVIEKTNGTYHYREAVLGRTARRLMEGSVLVPEKYFKDD